MAVALPPLNALRAFEAAARHQSFVEAAAELHVTPAAISHQVEQLEAILEVALFHRLPRGLVSTDAGKAMLPELGRGFAHVARAVQAAREGGLAGQLRVTVLPSPSSGCCPGSAASSPHGRRSKW